MAFKRVFSPSQVQTYLTCPRQYQAKYITKEVKFQQNDYAKFGDLVHKQIEDFLMEGKPMSPSLKKLQEVLGKHKGKLVGAELALGRSHNGEATTQYGKDAWFNSKIDAVFKSDDGSVVLGIDWKTGKAKEAPIQMDMNAGVLAAKYPEAKKVIMVFVHLYKDAVYVKEYDPNALNINDTINKIIKLEVAIKNDTFPPNPSGLCGKWCDVLSCPHNGKNK